MENPQTEKFAADTLLQKGVQIKIRAPFFIRCFGKKTIVLTVTSPFEGTMHRVASYYLSTGLTLEQLDNITAEKALQLMAVHGKLISKAVAVAVLNSYVSGYLFTPLLAWYLRWNCKANELYLLISVLLLYGGVSDFMNTTRSVRKMKLTTPSMGQSHQGS